MTNEQLDELERLEKAATTGPWEAGIDIECNCGESPNCWHTFGRQAEIFPPMGEVGPVATVAQVTHDNASLIASLRNAAPALLALARIGLAVQDIRPDEWEYMLKTFEAGNDRQWAIATAIRKALKGCDK